MDTDRLPPRLLGICETPFEAVVIVCWTRREAERVRLLAIEVFKPLAPASGSLVSEIIPGSFGVFSFAVLPFGPCTEAASLTWKAALESVLQFQGVFRMLVLTQKEAQRMRE